VRQLDFCHPDSLETTDVAFHLKTHTISNIKGLVPAHADRGTVKKYFFPIILPDQVKALRS
jgi:hypothetical protein